MNNAAVDMGGQISLQYINLISLDIYPEEGFMDHVIVLFKIFEEPLVYKGSLLSWYLPKPEIFCLFDNSHYNRYEGGMSRCGFYFHLPYDK